jgi:SAM-dependent methyltransferase
MKYAYQFESGTPLANVYSLISSFVDPGGTVVDLGAGGGAIAAPLIESKYQYVGADHDSNYVELLKGKGLAAVEVDLNVLSEVKDFLDSFEEVSTVLILDVLEHLVEPQSVLEFLYDWSICNGSIPLLISVPNVSHFDLGIRLLAGYWEPTPTGLLDATHLRFFTRDTLSRMLERTGWGSRLDAIFTCETPFSFHRTILSEAYQPSC